MKEKRAKSVILCFLSALLFTTLLSLSVYGEVPLQMNYQGYLTDVNGDPINATGNMVFTIYDSAEDGTVLWSESQTVAVKDGIYNVILGQLGNELDPEDFDGERYLGVIVGSDSEMTPRQLLTCSPFAIKAAVAESVEDGVITTVNLANNAVTEDKIDDGATIGEILDDDGAGSGLDSDLLDGQQSSYYRNAGNLNAGTLNNVRFSAYADLVSEGYLGDASGDLAQNNGTVQTNLNADRVDGLHASAFSSASHTHDTRYYTEGESNSRFVNETGDIMSGSTSGAILHLENTHEFGRGLRSYAMSESGTNYGIVGASRSPDGFGGYFYNNGGGTGLYGFATTETGGANGVYGNSDASNGRGVYGEASGTNGFGVVGYATGTYGIGVYGVESTAAGFAGWFTGDVHVDGTLSKAGGGFKIDHPLEPDNKYLNHSFVESPDMMNIYNGNVVLNQKGEAWVELPDWFETLNKDFRYQLTCIGGFAQVYIAQEIADNRFKIAGGEPEMKVSWQVTGIRQDPWANDNRIPVEEDKADKELGYYLHPEPYGQPEEKGIEWGRDPEGMQRMKEPWEKQEETNS